MTRPAPEMPVPASLAGTGRETTRQQHPHHSSLLDALTVGNRASSGAPPSIADLLGMMGNRRALHTSCPCCGQGKRPLSITRKGDGTLVWYCHICKWTGSSRAHRSPALPPGRPCPADHAPNPSPALALYAASSSIEPGSVAADYLQARGCVLPPSDGDLRWHPHVRHMSGHSGPALVALMTHAVTGEPLTVHRTWIDPDRPGRKAAIEPPRMYWPKLPTKHGVVRLWSDECVTTGLAIAEGIETALALAHAFTPVWACLDAGHMESMPVLAGVESLTMAVDHDPAGIRAARECADRWNPAEVTFVISPIARRDIADEAASW